MFPIRVKVCQESDLRMLGDLARNIQRVLPVTQADIDAAAALGKGWVVWKVVEVNDPIDNLRGGTQLVIKQNSITPGQNVRRVLIVQGPGGETVVIGPGPSPLLLPDAVANSLSYVKAFGGTEQNGTPTPDTPMDIVCNNGVLKVNSQGQIYTDGTVETINAHGKNLFDRDTVGITEGAIASSTGKNTSSSTRCRTIGYVPVKPNTTYTVSAVIDGYTGSSSAGVFVLEYTADSGDFESNYTGTSSGWKNPNGYTFTTGSTTHGIRFVFAYSTSGEISPSDITNIQLELGSTATAYQPYYDGGTATAEMLLKVGDYTDVQEILSGAVTRNIGVKVVDGTENWQFVNTSYSDGTHRIYCNGLFAPAINSYPNIPSGYCTNFPINSISNRDVQNLGPCLMWSIQGSVHLRATQFITLEVAKQWLASQYAAGTPVIIVYPLKEPTTESVAGQTLQVTQGDNVLEITQASIDGLELEAQYEQGVQASVQEIEP